jgi:hypothetical protein
MLEPPSTRGFLQGACSPCPAKSTATRPAQLKSRGSCCRRSLGGGKPGRGLGRGFTAFRAAAVRTPKVKAPSSRSSVLGIYSRPRPTPPSASPGLARREVGEERQRERGKTTGGASSERPQVARHVGVRDASSRTASPRIQADHGWVAATTSPLRSSLGRGDEVGVLPAQSRP